MKHFDLITLGIDRKEIEDNDISNVEKVLSVILKKDNDEIRYLKGRFSIAVSGYDKDKRELFQIDEFKKWAEKLMTSNPECIYYFDTKSIKSISRRLFRCSIYTVRRDVCRTVTLKRIFKD